MLSLGGCAVGPDFKRPDAPTDRAYIASPIGTLGSAGPGQTEQRLDLGARLRTDWWTLLQSPALDETVALALANNQTLAAAQANLAKAQEDVAVARGGLYPQVDLAGGVGRRQYGASFLGPQAFTFPAFSAFTVGPSVSYDPDVFGGTHRRIELAGADAEVQEQALSGARLQVAADTVIEAVQIAAIQALIDATRDVIASDEQNLKLVQAARGTGVASQMDVTTAQSQLDSDRARLPPLQQQLYVAQDALATLVGKSPASWAPPRLDLATLNLPQNIPLVFPSELVRARPDIRAAETQLHAASAAVGIATADLYPRISLTAAIAQEGLVGGPTGAAWSLVGGLTAPLFHGGALSANRRAAQDAYQSAFAQYQQTVLIAFQQVADNLHGLATAADAVRTEQQALDSATTALRLTRLGYGVGNAGIVQVLDAQRLQLLAELNLIQAQTRRYVQTINLFVAAGGGLTDDSAHSVRDAKAPDATFNRTIVSR
jgi:NodT family efflux transporter outer membrane factor (OMF) lipoprotein